MAKGTLKSGWCLTNYHENCPSTTCTCDCHNKEEMK